MNIQNPRATEIIRDETGLTLSEGFPQNISPNIVPVIDMTPSFHPPLFVTNNNVSTSGAGTILSAQPGKRYRIHGIVMVYVKDVTNDAIDGTVNATIVINGVTRAFASMPIITLTAQQDSYAIFLQKPITTDINTSIVWGSTTFTAGKLRRTITLYYEEIQ